MSFRLLLSAALAAAALVSCSSPSHITGIADLPLKNTTIPGVDWQQSPLRANAKYLLFGANTSKEKEARVGDYYYVSWHDGSPELPAKLVMQYTQARTASQILTRTIDYPAPRKGTGTIKAEFFFNGKERKQAGDILTWRMELYVGDKMVDSRQSYLWE